MKVFSSSRLLIEQLQTHAQRRVHATSRCYTTLFSLSLPGFFAQAIIGRSLPLSGVIYALVLAAPAWCPNCPYVSRRRRPQRPLWSGAASLSGPLLGGGEDYALPFFLYLLHLLPTDSLVYPSLPPFLRIQLPSTDNPTSPPICSYPFLFLRCPSLLLLQLLPSKRQPTSSYTSYPCRGTPSAL